MGLYLIIISISALLVLAINALCSVAPFFTLLLSLIIAIGIVYAIDAIVALLVVLLPNKCYNPFSKFAKVFKFERKLYEKLFIRKWKDKIPIGKGPFGKGKSKDKIESMDDINVINDFLFDSHRAEVMHFISAFMGFLILLFPWFNYLSIFLPVILVNFILQAMPFILQRYNRPKLLLVHKRLSRNKCN